MAAKLSLDPLGELAEPAPDLEDTTRRDLGHRGNDHVFRVDSLAQLLLSPLAPPKAVLAGIFAPNEVRVVELHRSRKGVPGIPRGGDFPPSQAFTVAPTSANSPSWIWPFAFLPST